MKVLVAEDDEKIASTLAQGLREAGYEVDIAHDGLVSFQQASRGRYDLLILDIMLPTMDGLEVLKNLRTAGTTCPVLILSAKRSVEERIEGLQLGADDYLTKPFAFGELLARCQALLRRSEVRHEVTPEATRLQQGDVSLDRLTREVHRGGKKIELQAKEFLLLEYFLKNPGQTISKTQILEHVWEYKFDPQTNVVDVLVCRLRNKLDREFAAKTIQTIRGVGYVFRPS